MKTFSWKTILRIITFLSLLLAAAWAYFEPGFEPVLVLLPLSSLPFLRTVIKR